MFFLAHGCVLYVHGHVQKKLKLFQNKCVVVRPLSFEWLRSHGLGANPFTFGQQRQNFNGDKRQTHPDTSDSGFRLEARCLLF